jgi:ubiquitin C-terminal hydrolase
MGVSTVVQALRKFVAVDKLRGSDKYRCEKCKKPVNADKQFTIDQAPLVLTVHLKRFTPFGKKITTPIQYQETLSLQSAMSNREVRVTKSVDQHLTLISAFRTIGTDYMASFATLEVGRTQGTISHTSRAPTDGGTR